MTLETENDEYKLYETLILSSKRIRDLEPQIEDVSEKAGFLTGSYGVLTFIAEKLLSPYTYKKFYEYAENELEEIKNKL